MLAARRGGCQRAAAGGGEASAGQAEGGGDAEGEAVAAPAVDLEVEALVDFGLEELEYHHLTLM